MKEKLYRYTTKGEGVFSAGKRLLPENLVEEIDKVRHSIPNPILPKKQYKFYLTKKGEKIYLEKYYPIHKKYLKEIKKEIIDKIKIKKIVYEDEYQVVEQVS